MKFVDITERERPRVNAFIASRWFSTEMAVRGRIVDMTKVDGIYAFEEGTGDIKGLITYVITDKVCEIMSFDSAEPGRGIGTTLLNMLIETARTRTCREIVLITTNDNIDAIRYYQRHGFDMARLYHNALDASRKLKPEIPIIGDNNIPLRHEIEFVFDLGVGQRS